MVTLGELVIFVALFWLILILIAGRVNLKEYKLYISSGFLLYIPDIFNRIIEKIASKRKFWDKFGQIAMLPTFVLFFAVPLFLLVNLIRGYFFEIVPIINISIIEVLRVETFVIIIPVLIIYISVQMVVSAIFALLDGEEMERSGILVVGVIFTFFATATSKMKRQRKVKGIAVIVLLQLLVVLLAFPLSTATQSGLNNFYGESQGAMITVIYPNSPAFDSSLQIGQTIVEIIRDIPSGISLTTEYDITSSATLDRVLAQIPPGEEFLIRTNILIEISGASPPSDVSQQTGSYLGLITEDYREPTGIFPVLFPLWMDILFTWIINLGLLFSVYSLLPLPNTPGKELMIDFIEKFNFDITPKFQNYISYFFLMVFGFNILYYII